jgi:2-polyprenyl-3-methyl-5-hydroxy-6-metoxy-1,4-benzoquinol methylase
MSVRGENKITIEERYKRRYKAGDIPWDIGKPDFNLIQTVTKMAIKPCKALDIGCGTGDNSIWLSQNGFHVIGIDTSEIAIQKAIEKASKANVKCNFIVIDFPTTGFSRRTKAMPLPTVVVLRHPLLFSR